MADFSLSESVKRDIDERFAPAAWQPIATAPTTIGARVLLFDGTISIGTRIEDGYWEFDQGGLFDEPTHWMPLPPPPGPAVAAPVG